MCCSYSIDAIGVLVMQADTLWAGNNAEADTML